MAVQSTSLLVMNTMLSENLFMVKLTNFRRDRLKLSEVTSKSGLVVLILVRGTKVRNKLIINTMKQDPTGINDHNIEKMMGIESIIIIWPFCYWVTHPY